MSSDEKMLTPAFELNCKTIFLFDGIGAVLSFFFTGIALPFFSVIVGISSHLLLTMSLFPFFIDYFHLVVIV